MDIERPGVGWVVLGTPEVSEEDGLGIGRVIVLIADVDILIGLLVVVLPVWELDTFDAVLGAKEGAPPLEPLMVELREI